MSPAAVRRRIAVVNPNTTEAMTATIAAAARGVVDPSTEVVAITNAHGPASIESHYDEALAVPGLLAEIAAAEADGVDGFVIACFGDPGLDAARELASGPVVGIAEAGFHAATLLGRSFSVVTTLARTMGQAEHLVQRYGFAAHCRSIYACEVPVLELDDPASDARKLVVDLCRRAVEHDEADSVVLGCAGMADFCQDVSEQVGVPVIDGVSAAVVLVESLVKLGLRTSTRSEYAPPLPKDYR
ncbi:aspartate/glutamate racemase family protein [Microlunatus spumicola]|uniref:Aspartate/glutamate racemase family protein n=1 Tax=Microlunatus spumicola TaxID=81499 RepID=A0ABP6WNJ9_9ACTN